MTELEYVIVTNRVKVSLALTILRDVLEGYGIPKEDMQEIMLLLTAAEQKLLGSAVIEPGE